MSILIKHLEAVSTPPKDKKELNTWLDSADALAALSINVASEEFILYAALPHAFLHAILVPHKLLIPPDKEDLMSWNCNAASSWGISWTNSNPAEIILSSPLDHTGSKTLDQGEQLVFARFFEGHVSDKNYYELLQPFIHVSEVHFVAERNAYCRLDENGDLEDVIRIVEIKSPDGKHCGSVILCKRDTLDKYMKLTGADLVLTFDFTKWRSGSFPGWPHPLNPNRVTSDDLVYDKVVIPGNASYVRGYQIVRAKMTTEQFEKAIRGNLGGAEDEKEYASFIAHDWKNNVVKEISCAPGQSANYFTKSELPYETSPAFFRPDVLTKYKTDSTKYRLKDRSVYCRGAWYLKTYDINEAGQIHTYICYLRDLPYQEQLYWKSFNEKPKGGISKRAFKSDFEASWDFEYDPLESLRHNIEELEIAPVDWWTLRSSDLSQKVHYPVTSSPDEWANEILNLDQLVVEGFNEKWLRKKAESLGLKPDPKAQSLKLTELWLVAIGCEPEQAREIMTPLQELHFLRSKLKGHAPGNEAQEIKKKALMEHGSYKAHFRDLCQRCDESFHRVQELLHETSKK